MLGLKIAIPQPNENKTSQTFALKLRYAYQVDPVFRCSMKTTPMRFLFGMFLFAALGLNAQQLSYTGDHAWSSDSAASRPEGRPHLRQADVMWAGRFWRFIDVRQKINLPLSTTLQGNGNQAPLWKVLQTAIQHHHIPAYRDDAFSEPLSKREVDLIWERVDTFMLASAAPPYTETPTPVVSPFDPSGIRFFQIKEEWFFDRHRSQLDVRILALGLVADQIEPRSGESQGLANLFWVRYSDIAPLLNSFSCYNPENLAVPMSYQDLFRNRLFHSMIYKRDNVFDRELADYAQGLDILLEGEEMKKELRNFEEDLWER